MGSRRLVLIDLSGVFRPAWASTADMEIGEAFARTVSKVHNLSNGYDLCAVCCDWPPYKRSKIHEQYKAHRAKPEQNMVEQFRRVKERLKTDGYLLWQVEGLEADDLVATAVQYAKRDELDVTIASSDKDLLCLVDDAAHVRQVSLATGEVFDQMAVVAKFGVAPRLMPDLLALMGDKSDNIPGIPGVGTKNAAKLLATYGNAANVVECAAEIKGAIGAAVVEHGGNVALAARLVALDTDAPIDWDALYAERTPQRLTDFEDGSKEEDDMDEPVDGEFESDPESAIGPPVGTQIEHEKPKPPPNGNGNGHAKPDAMATTEPQTQTMVRVPVEYSQALEPMSMAQAYKLAKGLFESRLYQRYGNAEAIWSIIMRGREMGLGALTSLDAFHNFQGKPMMHAHLIIARAKQDPDCEYFYCVETTADRATWETKNKRNPKPTRLTYTLEQAKVAGLVRQGGNWAQRPDEMIRKTSAVQLARMEYPGSALGLNCPEELGVDV
jgi:5'-3' exonuclease